MVDIDFLETLRLIAEANKSSSEACLKAIELIQRELEENKYIELEAAAAALGDISPEMLKERCTDGRFKHGKHFINTSDGKRGNYLVKIAAVRQYFETDPSYRTSYPKKGKLPGELPN